LGKGALAIGPIIVLPTYIGLSKNQPLTTQRYHANDRVPRKCIHGQEDYRRLAAKERLRLQPVIIRFMYITDRRIALRYIPHYRTKVGRKEAPAVRVYRSDPEGITLEIWREREFMSAWLPFADALAVADAICEAAKEGGAQ
jgi:hypothetical protein